MDTKPKKISNRIIVTIAFALIIFGICILLSNYISGKIDLVYENFNIDSFVEEQDEKYTEEIASSEAVKKLTENQANYLGLLEIDKIGLSRGFYSKESNLNNVNRNVTILEASDYPDKVGGNVIFAAHSGSSYLGFFKHLYKLDIGDTARITYKGKKYNYKITKIYYENKDGDIAIQRNKNKSTLTLITCTKDDNTKQTVYILERF